MEGFRYHCRYTKEIAHKRRSKVNPQTIGTDPANEIAKKQSQTVQRRKEKRPEFRYTIHKQNFFLQ